MLTSHRLASRSRLLGASRAIFVGQRGEFRDRAFQDQVHRASCLHLLVAAIAAWTMPYSADAIHAQRAEGEDVPDELIAHLAPIACEPVNFLGRYTFDPGNARPLDDNRPLRSVVVLILFGGKLVARGDRRARN